MEGVFRNVFNASSNMKVCSCWAYQSLNGLSSALVAVMRARKDVHKIALKTSLSFLCRDDVLAAMGTERLIRFLHACLAVHLN